MRFRAGWERPGWHSELQVSFILCFSLGSVSVLSKPAFSRSSHCYIFWKTPWGESFLLGQIFTSQGFRRADFWTLAISSVGGQTLSTHFLPS